MLRSVAVARIQQGLGFRDDRADEAAAALREAQRFFEKGKTLPWFLINEGVGALSLLASAQSVALPTGFIREVDRRRVYYTNTDGDIVTLKKKDFASAFDAYLNADAGAPEVYALRASTIYFFPESDAAYTITFPYFEADDVLDSDIENAWLANQPELLIGEGGYRLAIDMRDDYAATKVFDSMRKTAWDSLLREMIARDEANRDIALGSDL